MSEGEDLSVERNSAPETLPERRKQREKDREHVEGNLAITSCKFNRLSQYGVFSRDRTPTSGKSRASVTKPSPR